MSAPDRGDESRGPLQYAPKWARDSQRDARPDPARTQPEPARTQPEPARTQPEPVRTLRLAVMPPSLQRPAATQRPAAVQRPAATQRPAAAVRSAVGARPAAIQRTPLRQMPEAPPPEAPRQNSPRWRKREAEPFEGDVAIRELQEQLAIVPVDEIPEPPLREPRPAVFAIMVRFAGVIGLAAACALVFVWISAPSVPSSDQSYGLASYENTTLRAPELRTASLTTVTTRDARDGSPPSAAAAGSWPAVEPETDAGDSAAAPPIVSAAVAMPPTPAVQWRRVTPPNAAGNMDMAVTSPAAVPVSPPPAVVAPSPASIAPVAPSPASITARTAPNLGREDIAMLIARGRKYIADGDVVSARLVFRRAAQSGDATAALALGGTYDPIVLKQQGVVSLAADPARARVWYQKAADLGAPEAMVRIEQLGR